MALNLDGLIPATVLPMDADGSIDEPALRSYIGWVVAQGPVALAINVDTGEGPHLTHDEKVRILQIVRDVTDLPIVAGLAGPSTDAAVRQARDFQAAGADALLVLPDPGLPEPAARPARAGRVPRGHRRRRPAAHPVPAPAGPGRASTSRPTRSRRWPRSTGVVAIKEASFDARRFVDTARLLEQLPRPITLLTGNDNFILESFLLGATGALIGFGAVMTREQVDMIEAWQRGRTGRRRWRSGAACSGSPTSCSRRRSGTTGSASRSACASSVCWRPPTSVGRCCRSRDAERAFLASVLAEVGLLRGPPAVAAPVARPDEPPNLQMS